MRNNKKIVKGFNKWIFQKNESENYDILLYERKFIRDWKLIATFKDYPEEEAKLIQNRLLGRC